MDGLEFMDGGHMVIAGGCYLPYVGLLGLVNAQLHTLIYQHPESKDYVPNLLDVDLYVSMENDRFMLFVSPDKRGHLPARGIELKQLSELRAEGTFNIDELPQGNHEISDTEVARNVFKNMKFSPGFAAIGDFPCETYNEVSKAAQKASSSDIAKLLLNWAIRRKNAVENSRIFLSHKGANKPLISKVDQALRMLGLKTWFDRDDLAAGDPLVRGVDNAFAMCSAAVFFLSGDFADAGVIKREIDRALHEQAMREDGFKVIPIVLTQHGGSDDRVPDPLKTLVWKTVEDIDIVPTILRALPESTKALVKYRAPK